MQLNLIERIFIGMILPQQSDYVTMITAREIKDLVIPTSAELTEHKVVSNENGMSWSKTAEGCMKDLAITKSHKVIISEALQDLNKQKKLNAHTADLYAKFCLKADEDTPQNVVDLKE